MASAEGEAVVAAADDVVVAGVVAVAGGSLGGVSSATAQPAALSARAMTMARGRA